MKLRIKGNSIRLRLSRTDVDLFVTAGKLQEETSFGKNVFKYALKVVPGEKNLSADFDRETITINIAPGLIEGWSTNDIVGFNSTISTGENESLSLLVEKDFQCLDETIEDQSDNYLNPNKDSQQ